MEPLSMYAVVLVSLLIALAYAFAVPPVCLWFRSPAKHWQEIVDAQHQDNCLRLDDQRCETCDIKSAQVFAVDEARRVARGGVPPFYRDWQYWNWIAVGTGWWIGRLLTHGR